MKRVFAPMALMLVVVLAGVSLAWGQHNQQNGHGTTGNITDDRQLVHFTDALRRHTLANMRDHLLALQEIQEALARGQEGDASRIAEQRLGMSSLSLHGADEVAKYMPRGMQDVGTEMHHAASRFSIEVQNAGVTDNLKPALEALSKMTAACADCHAAYRIQ